MPKLKSQKFYYTTDSHKTCQISGHINSNGDFYVPLNDFPQEIINFNTTEHPTMRIGKSKGYTTKDVREGFVLKDINEFERVVDKIIRNAVENYKNQNKEKVIAYQFDLQGIMVPAGYVNEGQDDEYYQREESFTDLDSSSDSEQSCYGIKSTWGVYYRVKGQDSDREGTDHKYHYYDMDNRAQGRFYGDWKFIPWTQAREDYFKNLDASLKKIIQNVDAFRQANTEDIEKYIDTKVGGNLLDFKVK